MKQKINSEKKSLLKSKKSKIFIVIFVIIILFIVFFEQMFFYVTPFVFGDHPFFLFSRNLWDDHNTGFIYPLDAVNPNDKDEYVFIYYDERLHGEKRIYYICDNSDFIKAHKNEFIVFNSQKYYDLSSSGGDFTLYRNGKSIHKEVNFSYSVMIDTYRYTSIYDCPFEKQIIALTYDEMIAYCNERGLEEPR
ncbi:MAG: hypothetical protein LBL82_06530 [Oscillospiraceae bacterium]|nr:hypothetical protein [Oscillospiraceae bacterium]